MLLFSPSGPLEIEAIDIRHILTKTKDKNCYVIEMTDFYSKSARASPTAKVAAPSVTNNLFKHFVTLQRVSNTVLTDSDSKPTPKFFVALRPL